MAVTVRCGFSFWTSAGQTCPTLLPRESQSFQAEDQCTHELCFLSSKIIGETMNLNHLNSVYGIIYQCFVFYPFILLLLTSFSFLC